MNDIEFYKSFYDRELSRRIDLDNALNIPIGLIAILIALISYLISNINFCDNIIVNCLITGFTAISILLIFQAIYFLSKSYNNVFKGYQYLNFSLTTDIRKFQKSVESYNSEVQDGKEKIDIESELIDKLNYYTDK